MTRGGNWQEVAETELRRQLLTVEAEKRHLLAELGRARERVAQLEREADDLKAKPAEAAAAPAWTRHDTRLFRLLPAVIVAGQSGTTWPKQMVLVPDLMDQYGLTNAEARALDAVTRPDNLRGK